MLQKNKPLHVNADDASPLTRSASRRSMLLLATSGVFALALPALAHSAAGKPHITVWKTPDCGCCKEWVAHLRKNGFVVTTNDVPDTAPMRKKLGLDEKFGSCHSATIGEYVLEGHVPAPEIHRLLSERPAALGLAVPGMPVGSPGMEMGSKRQPFDVLLVLKDNTSRTYQSYPARA